MVPPPGIEPGSPALQTGAMTTSAKTAIVGQTLRIRSVPYAFTERNASTTPNAALLMVLGEGLEPS